MSIGDRLWHENRSRLFWLILALLGSISPDRSRAESCFVASEQSGIAFPAEKIAGDWSCRLQFVIDHHISASTVGPLKTAMAESLYLYLLDRPPVAAALINRLDLARLGIRPVFRQGLQSVFQFLRQHTPNRFRLLRLLFHLKYG